ncbi:MAG TPA: DUF5677 domain-containing protein [Rhizobacter sp.]
MNDLHIRGFLSADLAEQQQRARAEFAHDFRHCEQASERAVALIAGLRTEGMGIAGLWATGYWVKCVRACQAGIMLAERGMMADAQTQLRGAVESLFHAVALVNDPELWVRLVEHDAVERAKQVKGMLAIPTIMQHVSAEDRAQLEAMLAGHGEKPRPFSVYEAAQAARLLALYETMYRGLSRGAAHSTLSALEHELIYEADGSITPDFGPAYDQLPVTLAMIAECLSTGVQALAGRLG